MPSFDILQPQGQGPVKAWTAGKESSEPLTDKRELARLKPLPKHSSHEGPFKYLRVQKQMVLLIPPIPPFHNKEEKMLPASRFKIHTTVMVLLL